jgi:hypothetical protein
VTLTFANEDIDGFRELPLSDALKALELQVLARQAYIGWRASTIMGEAIDCLERGDTYLIDSPTSNADEVTFVDYDALTTSVRERIELTLTLDLVSETSIPFDHLPEAARATLEANALVS